MKKYLAVLLAVLALISIGAASIPLCTDGRCDYNYITQTNVADAVSGHAYSNNGGWDFGNLKLEQEQKNCAAVLGEGNSVTQSNTANAAGTKQEETQDNIAMVVGFSNAVSQSNNALATGVGNGPYGLYETQTQKNLLLVIGANNYATQSNIARAYSDSPIYLEYPIKQIQKNVGLLLGKKNWLAQSNDADATMLKDILVDPKIEQIQKNIAFAVNNCHDCKIDTSFEGTKEFKWPKVEAPAPELPDITCPAQDC